MNARSSPILPLAVLSLSFGCNSSRPAPSSPAGDSEGIGAPHYPVCGGQGDNPLQLAPMFLEKMPACEKADVDPADHLAQVAGTGSLIEEKGDCGYAKGISCHVHSSMEFVSSAKRKDDGVGELHCIVPGSDSNSPTVYGAHLHCKAGTTPATGTAACSSGLLEVLASAHCQGSWKCCDNGTLTKPVGKQSDAEKKVRPDFRVCSDDAIEIDRGLLHGMRVHTANVAGLGEEISGTFPVEDHTHH